MNDTVIVGREAAIHILNRNSPILFMQVYHLTVCPAFMEA